MQLFGCQLKAHESVLKVHVFNTEYHFLLFSFKKDQFKRIWLHREPWSTRQMFCCDEVWFPRLTPPCINCRGKNKIYENQAMHTYDIHVWYPGWIITWWSQPKGTWVISRFDQNAWLTLTEDMTKKITPTRHI